MQHNPWKPGKPEIDIDEISSRLSKEAKEKLIGLTDLKDADLLDPKSVTFGMKMARDGIKLTIEALAQSMRETGRPKVGQLLAELAKDLDKFPIVGE